MKTIIDIAREAKSIHPEMVKTLEAFAALARADEREACAKVVEDLRGQCWAYDHDQIATAIRAREKDV